MTEINKEVKKVWNGTNLKVLRKGKKMLQADLAKKLDLEYASANATISKWEVNRAQPSEEAIKKLATIFKVDESRFYTTISKPNNIESSNTKSTGAVLSGLNAIATIKTESNTKSTPKIYLYIGKTKRDKIIVQDNDANLYLLTPLRLEE